MSPYCCFAADYAYVERLLKDRLPQLVPDCSTFQSPELLQLYLEEVDDRLDAAKAGGIVLFIRRIKSHICCVSGQRGGVAAARERHVQSVNRGVGYGYAEGKWWLLQQLCALLHYPLRRIS